MTGGRLRKFAFKIPAMSAEKFGFVEAYRTRKAQIETWLTDSRPQVRAFAERFVRRTEQRIASEQRRAEQNKEMRRRDYEDPEKD